MAYREAQVIDYQMFPENRCLENGAAIFRKHLIYSALHITHFPSIMTLPMKGV